MSVLEIKLNEVMEKMQVALTTSKALYSMNQSDLKVKE